jgi:plasmid stability protein
MANLAARNTHQTTIRFPIELWRALELAAARHGVSVAQYIRDAARARLREGNPPSVGELAMREAERANDAEQSLDFGENAAALWQQGRLARERSRLLREEARRKRHRVP